MTITQMRDEFLETISTLEEKAHRNLPKEALFKIMGQRKYRLTLSVIAYDEASLYLARKVGDSHWWVLEESDAVWITTEVKYGLTFARPLKEEEYTKETALVLLGIYAACADVWATPVIAPPGCFIFQWLSQWAAGGEESSWEVHRLLVQAISVDVALRTLEHKLAFGHDNAFDGILVAVPGQSRWQELKTRNSKGFHYLRENILSGLVLS